MTVVSADEHLAQRLADGRVCFEAALRYRALGWGVLPLCPPDHVGVGKEHARKCKSPGKAPLVPWTEYQSRPASEEEIRQWWKRWPNANVGVVTGRVARVSRLDEDGPEAAATLRERGGLPPTPTFVTGRLDGGRGYLCGIPAGVALKSWSIAEGTAGELRIQCDGSQTVVPPSRHKSGSLYSWLPGRSPWEIELAPLPPWAMAAEAARAQPEEYDDERPIKERFRHNWLVSKAGSMRRAGFLPSAIEAALLVMNRQRCDPPVDDEEVLSIARSSGKWKPDPHADVTVTFGRNEQAAPPLPEQMTGVAIILTYFRERYRPDFRVGNSIHCQDGRTVPMGEACSVPDSRLIALLAEAVDAPRYKGGNNANRNALPGFFRTWAKVAWGDLLAELPDEDAADLGPEAEAPEEFRRLVREAMLSEVVLGDVIGKTGVTQIERRSLIDWCVRFGKVGPWRSVRSKKCWCKCAEKADGELVLQVAIRHELFSQLRADRRLTEMGRKAFTRRAHRYGVGTSTKENRPHGMEAVVLADDFVADLVAALPEENPPEG